MRTLVLACKIGPAFRTSADLSLPCGERPNGRTTLSVVNGSTYSQAYMYGKSTRSPGLAERSARKHALGFMLSLPAQDLTPNAYDHGWDTSLSDIRSCLGITN